MRKRIEWKIHGLTGHGDWFGPADYATLEDTVAEMNLEYGAGTHWLADDGEGGTNPFAVFMQQLFNPPTMSAKAQKERDKGLARWARITADPALRAEENAKQRERRHRAKALVRGPYKVKPIGERNE